MYPRDDKGRISYWTRQIEYARKVVKPYFDASNQLIQVYNNIATNERERTADMITPGNVSRVKANIVFAWIDQSIANLTSRDPMFSCRPLNSMSAQGNAPKVVASVINYWYHHTSQLRHDRRSLLDAFLCPYAVKKIGWTADIVSEDIEITPSDIAHYVIDEAESENEFLLSGVLTRVMEYQNHDDHIETHTFLLQDPLTPEESHALIEAHIDEHKHFQELTQPDSDTTIKWESPYGVRWEPDMFLIDPLARDGIRDARWVAFGWQKPVDEVKANPNYHNVSNLEPSMRLEDAPVKDPTLAEDDFGLVRGWEIWARNFPTGTRKRVNKLIVIAEGHDKILREDDEWPYTNLQDYPCEVMSFQQNVKTWINKPVLTLAGADNVQSLANEILDSFLYVIRKQKNIMLYDPDAISQSTIDGILNAPDCTAWPVEGLATKGSNIVMPMPFLNIANEKGEFLSLVQNLFDRAAGTPQPVRANTFGTATEASIHERRTTAREEARLDEFQTFQINTARKFWQLHQQFQPEQQFNIDPRVGTFAKVSPDIAKGEFQFRIDIGSQSSALAVERKQYLDLLNLMSGLIQPALAMKLPPPNIAKIAELLLVRGYDIPNPEELWPALRENMDEILTALAKDPSARIETLTMLGSMRSGSGTPEENGMGGGSANPVNPRLFSQPAPSPSSINADVNRV